MNKLIIFTCLDDDTRKYFNHFNSNLKDINLFEIENILFVSDKIIMPRLSNLKSYMNQAEDTYYIFYHKTARAFNLHKNYIDTIDHELIYQIPDHHNRDGVHYSYILSASECLSKNNVDGFYQIINSLIDRIKKNGN